MRRALFFSALLVGCASASRIEKLEPAKEPEIYVTSMADNSLHHLFTVFIDMARIEGWFCMIGVADHLGRTSYLQRLTPVWIDSADGHNMRGIPMLCPQPGTIGTVHFHKIVGDCDLGPADLGSAHALPFPITAIVCRRTPGGRPELVFAARREIDALWKSTNASSVAGGNRPFTPSYRYRPH